jgi:hypothetical protein
MGALRQPKLTEPKRKPVSTETRKLDRFGRDPESASELLRKQTDYAAQTGYSPLYHAALADLPRLASGCTCYALVLTVNMLSLGRPRSSGKDPHHEWTLPVSVLELAELCRANVRDIQRQLVELELRGLIAVKMLKKGGVKYAISLLYRDWQAIEDYAVWKRRQVVAIDDAAEEDEEEDAEQLEISRDAVHLFKKPAAVRPGRATRAAKVTVGVREVVCQNDSPTVDAAFSAVVQSGRLVVSATFKTGESEAKGEEKGNAERHPCRTIPPNEGIEKKRSKGETHPRAAEIVNIFDPLLIKSGSRLLSPDENALRLACAELGSMPKDALLYFVMRPGGRGSRPIANPKAVASIVREARQNWEAGRQVERASDTGRLKCKCGGEVIDVQAGLCGRCLAL